MTIRDYPGGVAWIRRSFNGFMRSFLGDPSLAVPKGTRSRFFREERLGVDDVKGSVAWENTIVLGAYRTRVVEIAPGTGWFAVYRGDEEVHSEEIALTFDPAVGPDEEVVAEWRKIALRFIIRDSRRRGEIPPS